MNSIAEFPASFITVFLIDRKMILSALDLQDLSGLHCSTPSSGYTLKLQGFQHSISLPSIYSQENSPFLFPIIHQVLFL
ncbi:hypothetical protein [Cuniculiplasma divulgatum]|uniref:hypothetical protein n=1 Tax=Cuniculiplasma divulgatum TaxID=1673428 RepID=UPI0015C56C7F|nr:hypothetical protein [Cuniculiplasma divulgatum]WMT49107.1 MAG: hypothetical protein RE472_08550 [Thermoplasmatales archaeon]